MTKVMLWKLLMIIMIDHLGPSSWRCNVIVPHMNMVAIVTNMATMVHGLVIKNVYFAYLAFTLMFLTLLCKVFFFLSCDFPCSLLLSCPHFLFQRGSNHIPCLFEIYFLMNEIQMLIFFPFYIICKRWIHMAFMIDHVDYLIWLLSCNIHYCKCCLLCCSFYWVLWIQKTHVQYEYIVKKDLSF